MLKTGAEVKFFKTTGFPGVGMRQGMPTKTIDIPEIWTVNCACFVVGRDDCHSALREALLRVPIDNNRHCGERAYQRRYSERQLQSGGLATAHTGICLFDEPDSRILL